MKKELLVAALIASSVATNAYAGYGHAGKGYIKIDLGAGAQETKQTLTRGLSASGDDLGTGILGGAGIGYYFMDELRVDMMLYFDKGMKAKKNTKSGTTNITMKGKEQSMGMFGNAYFDLLNNSDFIPYVMGGMGYLRNEFESEVRSTTLGREKKSRFSFGYQAGAGMSYHLSSNADLDIGYRYIHKGSDEYKLTIQSLNTDVKGEPGIVHAGILGLRTTF